MPNGSGNGLPGSDTAPGATGRQHPRTFLLSLSEQQKSRTMAKQEKTKAKSTGTAARLFAGRKIGETERWIYGFLLLFVSLFFLLAVVSYYFTWSEDQAALREGLALYLAGRYTRAHKTCQKAIAIQAANAEASSLGSFKPPSALAAQAASLFGWAALALLFGYLALFFWGSALAANGTVVGGERNGITVAGTVTGATITGPNGTIRGAPARAHSSSNRCFCTAVQPGPPNSLGQPKPSQPFFPRILAQPCMSSRVRRRALCTLCEISLGRLA